MLAILEDSLLGFEGPKCENTLNSYYCLFSITCNGHPCALASLPLHLEQLALKPRGGGS